MFLTRLGGVDLWAPDEPRYARVSEEMRSFDHGIEGVVLPHLNGAPYTAKPPLYFWAAAASGFLGGNVTEAMARLPSALSGIGCVALVLLCGARLLGVRSAFLGSVILVTVYDFARVARRAQLDVMLTLFSSLALFAFWRANGRDGNQRVNIAVFHAAMGLGVLVKGPVAIVVPVLIVFVFLACERNLREWRSFFPVWAFALSILPGLIWMWAAATIAPDVFLSDSMGNTIDRFLSGTAHVRPWHYYFGHFPRTFLPWTVLWPWVIWAGLRRVFVASGVPERKSAWRFLLVWVGVTFAFFSFSAGKRGVYMLTAIPALALLCGDSMSWMYRTVRGDRWALPSVLAQVAFASTCAVGAGCLAVLYLRPAFLVSYLESISGTEMAFFAGALIVSSGLSAYVLKKSMNPLLAALSLVFLVEASVFVFLFPAANALRSTREVAEEAGRLAPEEGRIAVLANEALIGAVEYYGRRDVVELASEVAVAEFLTQRQGPAIVRAREIRALEERLPLRIHARSGKGSRHLVVVSPRD